MEEQPAKKDAFLQFFEAAKFLKYLKGQRNELCNQKRENIDFKGPAKTAYTAYLKAVSTRTAEEENDPNVALTPFERKLLEVEKRKLPPSTRDILFYLLKHGNATQRDVAKYAHISSSSTSIIIKHLLALEIIQKEQGEVFDDGLIALTEFGILVSAKYSEDPDYLGTNVFEGFSEDEMTTFSKLLARMHANCIRKIYEMKK